MYIATAAKGHGRRFILRAFVSVTVTPPYLSIQITEPADYLPSPAPTYLAPPSLRYPPRTRLTLPDPPPPPPPLPPPTTILNPQAKKFSSFFKTL